MPVHGHAPGACEGSVAMVASFRSRTLSFCRSSIPQFLLAELELLVIVTPRPFLSRMLPMAHRLRHTRRLMQGGPPQATPSSDVGDATCALGG